jgi:hypothetical protein
MIGVAMRWLAVWLVLTGVYFAGQLATPLLVGERWRFTSEDLAHLTAVPVVQVVALWVVVTVRRQLRR